MWQLNVMILKKVVKVHHLQAEGLVIFITPVVAGRTPYWSITTVTGLYYAH